MIKRLPVKMEKLGRKALTKGERCGNLTWLSARRTVIRSRSSRRKTSKKMKKVVDKMADM